MSSACFSWGTCTATCPLVDGDGAFPRRIIRHAHGGLKVLLAPFMKLAHAVYPPFALFFVAIARSTREGATGAADGG